MRTQDQTSQLARYLFRMAPFLLHEVTNLNGADVLSIYGVFSRRYKEDICELSNAATVIDIWEGFWDYVSLVVNFESTNG